MTRESVRPTARGLHANSLTALGVPHFFGLRGDPAAEPEGLLRPVQVHGAVVARAADRALDRSEADAVTSREPGCWVGIVTADCVPILVARADGRAVAAIHAGWRGLAAGVVEAAIAALRGADDDAALHAAVGPRIGRACYEVDAPVLDALRARYGAACVDAASQRTRPGHAALDLGALVATALGACGVETEVLPGVCTACDAEHFHSFRRDGARAGRLLHAIAAKPVDSATG